MLDIITKMEIYLDNKPADKIFIYNYTNNPIFMDFAYRLRIELGYRPRLHAVR